jgi:N-succinyldiaminopimelate aminotransferase
LNPDLDQLHPYPFERLRELFAGVAPHPQLQPINLSIGEPRHATPEFIKEAFAQGAAGLANYPTTAGSAPLRDAIAAWLTRRHGITALDAGSQVLPVLGSREALFAFAQCVVDRSRVGATVVVPNPFYQIYEGATLLAGATPHFYTQDAAHAFRPRWSAIGDDVWRRTQLVYICSPDNPTGRTLALEDWRTLFELSARHGFVVAADECYSEIFFDEHAPPLGALAAAQTLGNTSYERLLVFGSLSKRSNVPGMRSGFVAGDARLIKSFLLYRTYHGSAMSPAVAHASIAAWNDEAHVIENRRLYAQKFRQLTPALHSAIAVDMPEAAFYWWLATPIADTEFARELYRRQAVTVLPGSYLAREWQGDNPGAGRVRVALVAGMAQCEEAVERMKQFVRSL